MLVPDKAVYRGTKKKVDSWQVESVVGVRRIGRVVEYRVHYYLFSEKDRTWEPTRSFDIELACDSKQTTVDPKQSTVTKKSTKTKKSTTKKKGKKGVKKAKVSDDEGTKNMEEALNRFWDHIKERHGISQKDFMKSKSSPPVLWCSRRFYREEQARYQELIGNPKVDIKDRADDALTVLDPLIKARDKEQEKEPEEDYAGNDAEVLAGRRAIDSNSPMTEEASEDE